MKKATVYFLIAIMLITVTACAYTSMEDSNIKNSSEPAIYTEPLSDNQAEIDEHYSETVGLIDEYMSRYLGMNFENSEVTEDSEEVFGYSTEGGRLTEFKYENGNPIRYRLNLYGETGNFEGNYYAIGDSRGYYTALKTEYDSWQRTKVQGALDYEFEEYWIDGDKIYRMDNISKRLVQWEENPIAEPLLEALNK